MTKPMILISYENNGRQLQVIKHNDYMFEVVGNEGIIEIVYNVQTALHSFNTRLKYYTGKQV